MYQLKTNKKCIFSISTKELNSFIKQTSGANYETKFKEFCYLLENNYLINWFNHSRD